MAKAKAQAKIETKKETDGFLITKIIVAPSRKVGLKNYSSVDMSAGMEVVFDEPQKVDSPKIQEAFDKVHTVLQAEFRKQFALFGEKKETPKTE